MKRIILLMIIFYTNFAVPFFFSVPYFHVYFSPDDHIAKKFVSYVEQEKKSIKIAAFLMTHKEIINALRIAVARGIKIDIILDPKALSMGPAHWVDSFLNVGIKLYLFNTQSAKVVKRTMQKNDKAFYAPLQHNKFSIFERNFENKKLLWTGSFNFTHSADIHNQENVVVFDDPEIVQKFEAQFHLIKTARSIRLTAV